MIGQAHHIHITGATGSGTTTLGRAVAERLGIAHLDSDDYFWEPTEPPFQNQREPEHRLRLLEEACDAVPNWVLSGSFMDWGNPLIPAIDLVIFIYVPAAERIARLKSREIEIFGLENVKPGGAHHETYTGFLEWAAAYDSGEREGRSLPRHEAWLAALSCPILRIEGAMPLEDSLSRTVAGLKAIS